MKVQNKKGGKKVQRVGRTKLIIVSSVVLVLIFWLFRNWTNIDQYLETLKVEDPVSKAVIEDYDSSESPHYSSGMDKTIVVISDPSSEEGSISSLIVLTSSDEKGFYLVQYIPGEVYIKPCNCDINNPVPISSLPYIGERFGEGLGYEFTIWQIEKLLATEFDSYIWIKKDAVKVLTEKFGFDPNSTVENQMRSLNRIGSWLNLLARLEEVTSVTNNILSNIELKHIYSQLKKFDLDQSALNTINYSLVENLTPSIHPNGDDIYILENNAIDVSLENIKEMLLSKNIEREQAKVEVYNGSVIPGLASRYSRILENNGLNVVRIGNSEKGYAETTIYVPNKDRYANTLDLVKVLVGQREYNVLEERPIFLSTGDIVVVLGQDLSENSLPYVIY